MLIFNGSVETTQPLSLHHYMTDAAAAAYRSSKALILPVIFFTYFVIFSTQLFLLKTFKALNGLLCADVPLRNYSLTAAAAVVAIETYDVTDVGGV